MTENELRLTNPYLISCKIQHRNNNSSSLTLAYFTVTKNNVNKTLKSKND